MAAFETIVTSMSEMGVFHLFFPWLLVLAVSYGILEKYNVFSDEAGVNGVISLALAFITIGGIALYVPRGMWMQFTANIAFGILGLIGFMLLLGVAGYDLDEFAGWNNLALIFGGLIGIVAFIAALIQFGGDVGALGSGSGNLMDQVVMPILTLVFLLLVVLFTAGDM